MQDLRGRHAVVTGASRGIGVVIAETLAREGMNLTIAARSVAALEATKARAEQHGARVVSVPTDVADPDARHHLVETAVDTLGPIDVLVNNAGIETTGSFVGHDEATIEQVVAVNLTAPLVLSRIVLPAMLERGDGCIVNISSTAGKTGAPYLVPYSATKSGLIAATEALRAELDGTGVHVSVVCPGFVEDAGMYERMVEQTGVHASRILGVTTPQKVADAVVRAIRHDASELIVNSMPIRPIIAFAEMVPALRTRVTNLLVRSQMRATAEGLHRDPN